METILIATDFSAPANNAAEYGAELAKFFCARLVLVNAHAMPPTVYDTGISLEAAKETVAIAEAGLADLKSKLLKKHPGLEVETFTAMGFSYDVIHEEAKKYKADLVVMGMTGEATGIKEHLIGSNALRAARNFEMPVFIIPVDAKYHRVHKISFACDLNKTENTSLAYSAKYFSKIFDAQLEIVHVEVDREMSVAKSETINYVEEKLKGIEHNTIIINDEDAGEALQDYFNAFETDLILINPKKHNILQNVFTKSVTRKLAFHSKLPILAIH